MNKTIQSLQKGLRILELVAAHPEGVGLQALAKAAGCSAPAGLQLAHTLVLEGYLERSEQPVRYRLGTRFFALWQERAGNDFRVRMERTFRETAATLPGCAICFCQARAGELMVTDRLDPTCPDLVAHDLAHELPAYTSIASLVHLAHWPVETQLAYRQRHPFEEYGIALWKTENAMAKRVREFRAQGYVRMPGSQPWHLRAGVAVWGEQKALIGSLTLDWWHKTAAEAQTKEPLLIEAAQQAAAALGNATVQQASK